MRGVRADGPPGAAAGCEAAAPGRAALRARAVAGSGSEALRLERLNGLCDTWSVTVLITCTLHSFCSVAAIHSAYVMGSLKVLRTEDSSRTHF